MKKRLIASVTCLCLLLVMLMSSTLAWFTDSEMSHNTMTVGNVEIEQIEQYREDGILRLWTDDYKPTMIPVVPEGLADTLAEASFEINGTEYTLFKEGQLVIDKIVSVKNVGSDPAYVRTVFAFELTRTDDGWNNPLGSEVFINDNPNQKIEFPTVQDENGDEVNVIVYRYVVEENDVQKYIYSEKKLDSPNLDAAFVIGVTTYAEELDKNEVSVPSLLQVYLDKKVTDSKSFRDSVNGEYEILALSQAMQFAGFENYAASTSLNHAFGDVIATNVAKWLGGGDVLPVAHVKKTNAMVVETSTHGLIAANDTFQFLPPESYEDAHAGPYATWHVDFVVSADNDIPAGAVVLPGYYAAYCDNANQGKWIGLSSDEIIPAGTEIRLVYAMTGGNLSVNYEEICKWGNDNVGFKCGIADMSYGALAGAKLTVELRLYETYTEEESIEKFGVKSTNYEKADYEVNPEEYVHTVGTYTYTFGETTLVGTADQLQNAINSGAAKIELLQDIDLGATQITVPAGKTVELDLNNCDLSGSYDNADHYAMFKIENGASLTIEGDGNVTATTNCTENNRSLAIFQNAGKLTINGGTYNLTDSTTDKTWIIATIVDNRTNSSSCQTVLTINGGDFSIGGNAINLFRNYPQQGGTATINFNGGVYHANPNKEFTYIWNQESGSNLGELYFYAGTYDSNVVYEDYNGHNDIHIAEGVSIKAYPGNT